MVISSEKTLRRPVLSSYQTNIDRRMEKLS